jgi:hypothetical protein
MLNYFHTKNLKKFKKIQLSILNLNFFAQFA